MKAISEFWLIKKSRRKARHRKTEAEDTRKEERCWFMGPIKNWPYKIIRPYDEPGIVLFQ